MAHITTDDVNAAYASISGRTQSAVDKLTEQGTFLGSLIGSNDAIVNAIAPITNLAGGLNTWRDNGLDIAQKGDDSAAEGWANKGTQFTKILNSIDGQGEDPTIARVLSAKSQATWFDLGNKEFVQTWAAPVVTAVIAAVVLVFVLKVSK